MPIFEYECLRCGNIFELLKLGAEEIACPLCMSKDIKRLISRTYMRFNRADRNISIEKRCNEYVRAGKLKEAARFMDKACEYVKTDKVKQLREKIYKGLK